MTDNTPENRRETLGFRSRMLRMATQLIVLADDILESSDRHDDDQIVMRLLDAVYHINKAAAWIGENNDL